MSPKKSSTRNVKAKDEQESLSNVAIKLGNAFRKLPTSRDNVPVYVWTVKEDLSFKVRSAIRFRDNVPTFTGFDSLTSAEKAKGKKLQPEAERCYIGYDIEYTTDEVKEENSTPQTPRLLSHQFYYAHNGERKGLVLLTGVRFTEAALIKFIAAVVPKHIKKVYLVSHFSHAECGWLKPGRKVEPGYEKKRETEYCNPAFWLYEKTRRAIEYKKKHGKEPDTKDGFVAVYKLLPIKKRAKKWVGHVGLYKKGELDRITEFGKKKKKNSSKTKTLSGSKGQNRDIDHIALVRQIAGGKSQFHQIVNDIITRGNTKAKKHPEWKALIDLNTACRNELMKINGFSEVPNLPSRQLIFADSMDLLSGSLSAIGSMIDVKKIELKEGEIEQMDKLLVTDEKRYLEYAIRDAIVTAECVAYFGQMFWKSEKLPMQIRTAGYSSKLFTGIFKSDILQKTGRKNINVKHLLGWEERFDEKGKKTGAMWPGAAMEAFALYYYGGWAACHAVGPREGAVYHDLKSAYPSAIAALKYDYNFGETRVYRDKWAEKMVERMKADGPFQIAGVTCTFKFRKKNPKNDRPVEPFFPIKVDKTWLPPMSIVDAAGLNLFPRCGYAHVTWPEFYLAYKNDLLEDCTIHHIVTFDKLEGESQLASETLRLLEERGKRGNKAIYKGLLNFYYGKSSEGIGKKSVVTASGIVEQRRLPGALTCFPIGAYTTSVCRASIAELLQNHDCYGIATDGFISPDQEVKGGEICEKIQELIKNFKDENEIYVDTNGKEQNGWKDEDGIIHNGKPYEYIENDFTAKKGLYIKTRGYAMIGDKKDSGKFKMAQMGVQVNEKDKKSKAALDEFIDKLKALSYKKRSTRALDSLKKDGKDDLPTKRVSLARVNVVYDFKRVPITRTIRDTKFTYSGVTYECVEFETAPLETVEDFIMLRQLARGKRQLDTVGYKELMEKFYRTGFGSGEALYD